MGTSTTNSGTTGNGTPLVPSWVDDSTVSTGKNDTNDDVEQVINQPADPGRYVAARSSFSRFAKSGGQNKSALGRSISQYVSVASGGASGATRRMGASKATSSRLIGFLNDVSARGLEEVLKSLNLDNLAGRPIDEIFKGISDYICPEGGNIDVAIARNAFFNTIVELEENGITDLDNLDNGQIESIFEIFTTNTIEDKLYNEIGIKAILLPDNTSAIDEVETQVHEFIENGVSKALGEMKIDFISLPQDKLLEVVNNLYEKAFELLVAMGENEGEVNR